MRAACCLGYGIEAVVVRDFSFKSDASHKMTKGFVA